MVTGKREQLEELISWCKTGPPAAKVKEVMVTEIEMEIFDGFEIRRD